jgi:hypothetical protein
MDGFDNLQRMMRNVFPQNPLSPAPPGPAATVSGATGNRPASSSPKDADAGDGDDSQTTNAKPPSGAAGPSATASPAPNPALEPSPDKTDGAASSPKTRTPSGGSKPAKEKKPAAAARKAEQRDPAKVDELLSAVALSTITKNVLDRPAAEAHLNTVLAGVNDPIERMLLESFVLLHERVIWLHADASQQSDAERVRVFNSVAARLAGEERRLALAIRQYRSPVSSRSFAVIGQQNVSGGDQKISYTDQSSPQEPKVSLVTQSNVEGNSHEQPFGGRFASQDEEPAKCGSGKNQRPAAALVGT